MLRVAINGFGRIGRNTLRTLIYRNEDIQVVAINDLTDSATLAHLFKYDSVHGPFQGEVTSGNNKITINTKEILILNEREPSNLPWRDLDVDVVVESTGFFTKKKDAEKHLKAGANQVIVSAPSPSKEIPTLVLGVNDSTIDLSLPL